MPPSLAAPAPHGAPSARLARLAALPRRPGEASFFYHDPHFGHDAVKVLPGEFYVDGEELLLTTTLGSCIAACLWDRERRVGGMNHFLLPEGSGADSARYGVHAMDLLVGQLVRRGATRATLEAKVFGGGAVASGMHTLNVGERNTAFVLDYLRAERIAVVSQDVLGIHPRKVCFLPASGKAMVKRLASVNTEALTALEHAARLRGAAGGGGGSVDLF